MQQSHAARVLVSVGYRKQPVHILALSFLPFASLKSGDAIGGEGWGWRKEQWKGMQIKAICLFVRCSLSSVQLYPLISEETDGQQ